MAVTSLAGRSVLRGAGVALAVAAPAALIGQGLTSVDVIDDESNWLIIFFLVIVAAFAVGGWMAGRAGTESPLRDGALAAFLAYAAVQVVGVVRVLVAGDDVDAVKIVFNALLAACLGAIGATFAQRRYVRISDS